MRPLKHADHRKFVEIENWTKKGTSRGARKTGDHWRYTLTLATGEVLHTRVSHGSGSIDDPNLVADILRNQLQVTEEDFYRCVNDRVLPPRPVPERPPIPDDALDAKLVRNLIKKAGYTQADVAAMTRDVAIEAWNRFLTEGPHRA